MSNTIPGVSPCSLLCWTAAGLTLQESEICLQSGNFVEISALGGEKGDKSFQEVKDFRRSWAEMRSALFSWLAKEKGTFSVFFS